MADARLKGLDLARFKAFAFMVAVNFAIVMGADSDQESVLAPLTRFLEGKAAASFVVLAGLGMGLAAARSRLATTLRRALFLFVLGMANCLIFEADILHFYAFHFLIGAFFLHRSALQVTSGALFFGLGFFVLAFVFDYDQGWDWKTYDYADFWTVDGFVRNTFFNGFHPVFPWAAFFLAGVLLARAPLDWRAVQWGLFLGGAALVWGCAGVAAVGVELFSRASPDLAPLMATSPIPPGPVYVMTGVGAAATLIGACLLLPTALGPSRMLAPLEAAGRQSLTLYVAHILIGMGALEALGLLGGRTLAEAWLAAAIFCALGVAFAHFWAQRFGRGPLETAMRRMAG